MRKDVFKAAFIGGGLNSAVGTTHKIGCQMDGRFVLEAGAFSRHHEINAKTAEEWGVAQTRTYDDYHEMLHKEKGKIDVIIVLTPTPFHKDAVIDALNAGYAVICEKALATSVAEADEMQAAITKNKSFFCVMYNYTAYPIVRELKRKIERGDFGKIQQVQIEMPQEGFMRLNAHGEKPQPQSWRLNDYRIPTISLDLGTHLHNMIYFLTGEHPLSVVADKDDFGFFKGIADNVSCLAKYTNGLKAQIWYSKTALGNRNGLRVRIYGEKGSAEWVQIDPENLTLCDSRGTISKLDRTGDTCEANLPRYNRFKAGHPAGFIEAFGNYYMDVADCLKQFQEKGFYESPFVCGINESREGMAMFEAVIDSARTEAWVKVKQ